MRCLFVGSMLFHLAGTWSLPLVDRDEPRFAEASREMIQRSDYVVPYFNNHFRLDKPPLTIGLRSPVIACSAKMILRRVFPSAIAACACRLVDLCLGDARWREQGRLVGRHHLYTSLQTFLHGKAAGRRYVARIVRHTRALGRIRVTP